MSYSGMSKLCVSINYCPFQTEPSLIKAENSTNLWVLPQVFRMFDIMYIQQTAVVGSPLGLLPGLYYQAWIYSPVNWAKNSTGKQFITLITAIL